MQSSDSHSFDKQTCNQQCLFPNTVPLLLSIIEIKAHCCFFFFLFLLQLLCFIHIRVTEILLSCSQSHKLFVFSNPSYRKVVSNNCTAGVSMEYTARRQQCPIQAPRGLHLVTSEGTLTATLGTNVTFLVFLEEVSCFMCFSKWTVTPRTSHYIYNV